MHRDNAQKRKDSTRDETVLGGGERSTGFEESERPVSGPRLVRDGQGHRPTKNNPMYMCLGKGIV